MPQDIIQLKLLMALSLYINTLRQHPPTLVPATSEQLFGMKIDEKQDIESDEYDYEYESEEVIEEVSEETEVASSTAKATYPVWDMAKRTVDLNDQQEPIERLPELSLIEPV